MPILVVITRVSTQNAGGFEEVRANANMNSFVQEQ
jgi:hypothetical protein